MDKPKIGRPTTYKPEYCDLVIQHMSQGLSFESFAGLINSQKDTLYNWLKIHEEFKDAKKEGEAKSMIFWEKMGVAGAAGKIKNFNSGCWIFNLKNRFGWKDKMEVTAESVIPITLNYLPKSKREDEGE